jgi:hypothetical protein
VAPALADQKEINMDLYLPDDFVPHAEYSWTDSLHATHAREEGFGTSGSDEDWLGGEALLTPALQHDVLATRDRYDLLYATQLGTDPGDWCAL